MNETYESTAGHSWYCQRCGTWHMGPCAAGVREAYSVDRSLEISTKLDRIIELLEQLTQRRE